MQQKICMTLLLAVLLLGCAGKKPDADAYDPAHDYFSYANTTQFLMRHLALDLTVNFDARVLQGSATLAMHSLDPGRD